MASLLIADDEKNIRSGLELAFEDEGYTVVTAADGKEAWEKLQKNAIDLVITDLRMPEMDGYELLKRISAAYPTLPVIVLTGHGTIETAVETMRDGAVDFFTKPVDIDKLSLVVKKTIAASQLAEQNRKLAEEIDKLKRQQGYGRIIGKSGKIAQLMQTVNQVASTKATVLITGESGTGKELVAKAIQKNSSRADKPFIAVNCAALPEGLIESELFGHEKGSFTGAINRKIGLAELANTGTLFLDEIGDLSQPMQLKLLRFIQEHTFYRVGGNEERKVDVRIIAATSRNLEEMIAKGDFREDLYYRLNVFPIYMPALRNRKSDIILLAEYFLKKYSQIHNKPILRISTPAINMMTTYHWPGNVRELENCIEYAVLNTSDNFISGYNLPPSLQTAEGTETSIISPSSENGDYESMVASFEKELIVEALKLKHGNASAAAKHLGATQRVILYKIKKLGIDPSLYK